MKKLASVLFGAAMFLVGTVTVVSLTTQEVKASESGSTLDWYDWCESVGATCEQLDTVIIIIES